MRRCDMARGKKAAKALTLEEKLEQALVPEEEQPYVIPENWCWVKFGYCIELISGRDVALSECNDRGLGIPYILGASNINNNKFIIERWIKVPQVISRKNDILLSVKGTIGKLYIQQEESINISRQIMAIRLPEQLILRYVYYFLQNICDVLQEAGNGLIPGISRSEILDKTFMLPPIIEQQRIVTRIESLFAKLDEAKEKAQVVIDGFELRKSAILHKAFTGELTEQWRKEHGVGLDSWETVTSKKLFEYVTSGSRGWAQYYSQSGAVFVRMGNLQHSTIELDMSSIQYVDLPDKAEGQRSLIKKNDILISITADVGMIGLVRDIDFEGYINQHVALARPAELESAEFIAWYLVSDVGFKQFRKKQRGATKVGLGLNDIRTLCLDMPIMAEQKEILNILNRLMIKEHQAKQAAESVLAQIDTMKKAILVRAFRGELGTNNPSDENAIELLKEVLAEKN